MSQATTTKLTRRQRTFVRRDIKRKRLKYPDICGELYSEIVEDVMDVIHQNQNIRNMCCHSGNTKNHSNAYAT